MAGPGRVVYLGLNRSCAEVLGNRGCEYVANIVGIVSPKSRPELCAFAVSLAPGHQVERQARVLLEVLRVLVVAPREDLAGLIDDGGRAGQQEQVPQGVGEHLRGELGEVCHEGRRC